MVLKSLREGLVHSTCLCDIKESASILHLLVPPQLAPLTFGRDVVDDGDFAQLNCIAMKGDEPLTISWTFHGQSISGNLGIVITPLGNLE